jgi:hypothetical protein
MTIEGDIDPDALKFVKVAELIADPPPEWLVSGLTTFAPLIGIKGLSKDNAWIVQQRLDDIDRLIGWLPNLLHWQPDIPLALVVLTRIRDHLALSLPPARPGGQAPHYGRQLCAILVVQAWSDCRGQVEPRSEAVYRACQAYWEACGGEAGGDIDNWRRHVQAAADRRRDITP